MSTGCLPNATHTARSEGGRRVLLLLLSLGLLTGSCSGSTGGDADLPTLQDATADSEPPADLPRSDLAGEITSDASQDGTPDATPEASFDAGHDAPLDLHQDVTPDGETAVAEDAAQDSGVDLAADLSGDLLEDASFDAVTDVTTDVPWTDLAVDAGPDVLPECVDEDPAPCIGSGPDGLGGCKPVPLTGTPCDDADPCTGPDSCLQGKCQPGKALCECESDQDCSSLEDGDLCNGTLVCDLSEFPYSCEVAPGTVVQCPDAEGVDAFCFTPDCDPATGKCSLLPANTGKACPDGSVCTVGDYCTPEGCKSYFTADCDPATTGVLGTCDGALGCLFDAPLCGNKVLDPGEECDEGVPLPQGTCTGGCQKKDVQIVHPWQVTDMDVAYDGSLVVTSQDYQFGPRVQCFGPDRKAKGDPKLWLTLSDNLATNSDPPRVIVSGAGKVALAGWRHYTVKDLAQSRRLTVRFVNLDCTFASEPIQISEDFADEWWDMDIDDAGWSAVAWMHPLGHPRAKFFSPSGKEEAATPDLLGGECGFGVHTALSPIANGAIVTCQGHSNGIWAWTFDASGQLVASGVEVPGALGHSSWYDSHTVLASAGGHFLVVWADAPTNKVQYSLIGLDGSPVYTGVLFNIANPTPFCYDMYRWYDNKNNVVEGHFVVPFVNEGDCFAKDHHGLAVIPIASPAAPAILSLNERLQTITFDARGGTYILDKDWQVRANALALP